MDVDDGLEGCFLDECAFELFDRRPWRNSRSFVLFHLGLQRVLYVFLPLLLHVFVCGLDFTVGDVGIPRFHDFFNVVALYHSEVLSASNWPSWASTWCDITQRADTTTQTSNKMANIVFW